MVKIWVSEKVFSEAVLEKLAGNGTTCCSTLSVALSSQNWNIRSQTKNQRSAVRCLLMGLWRLPKEPLRDQPLWEGRRGLPNLFRFPRSLLICSDLRSLFRECPDLFRFDRISSDLFRPVFRTNQGNPFLPTPFASPRQNYTYTYASWLFLNCLFSSSVLQPAQRVSLSKSLVAHTLAIRDPMSRIPCVVLCPKFCESANRALLIVLEMPLNIVFLRPQNWSWVCFGGVSTKTLLLKHFYTAVKGRCPWR